MTLSHHIKLIIPRFKWWSSSRKERADFLNRKKLFPILKRIKKECKEEFESKSRINPNLPGACVAQGRYEMVCEVLRNVGK